MKRVILYWCILLGSLLGAGCNTDVELCYDEHPHRTLLDFQFSWKEEDFSEKPDSMHVVAIRMSNTIRYDFRVTSHPTGNTGVLLSPDSERDEEASDTVSGAVNDKLWVRSGPYQFIAYTSSKDLILEPSKPGNSQGDQNMVIGLKFRYASTTLNDYLSHISLASWDDYNPYSGYIKNGNAIIYQGNVNYQTIPVHASTDTSKVVVNFKPALITPRIYFDFDIQKEEEVVIDSIWAEISGIPESLDFVNNVLDLKKTYKMLFRADYTPLPAYSDSTKAMTMKASGRINATSLVPSYSQKLTTGPGILHLAAYTHVKNEDGTKKGKIFRVCINLYNTLNASGLLVWNAHADTYGQGALGKDYHLRIATPLKVAKDRILNNEDETVMDNWKELGRIDIDI